MSIRRLAGNSIGGSSTASANRIQQGELDRSLAALQAELYRLPKDQLTEHARLRAEATRLCDSLVSKGNSTAQEWTEIERLLRSSWRSLWDVVNAQR
jgi:hypothetical protein